MKSELEVYKSSLRAIEQVYVMSEYGDNDLYRIKDIIHSLSKNHWDSKQWLAEKLVKILNRENILDFTVLVQGGWYGLMGHLLLDNFEHVISLDSDDMTDTIGYEIFGQGVDFQIGDMFTWTTENRIDVVVNTSCEHVNRKDLCDMISKYNGCTFALQSNNENNLMSHVNTSETLADFVDYIKPNLPNQEIMYAGQLPQDNFTRFMIIGR